MPAPTPGTGNPKTPPATITKLPSTLSHTDTQNIYIVRSGRYHFWLKCDIIYRELIDRNATKQK